jgi:opacity protein-like surface antigen
MRIIAAAAAAALAVTLSATASAADAPARDWATMTRVAHAKLQACKEVTTPGGPWRIRLRVNATAATSMVRGSAEVRNQRGDRVGQKWRSGRVHPGDVSNIGSLRLPRGSAFLLEVQLESASAGKAVIGAAPHRC